MPNEEIIIDIETYVKENKPVPTGVKYQIKVDKEKYTFDHEKVSGSDVLTKAGRQPVEQFRLDLKIKGGATRQIHLDDIVDLSENGVEKFLTLKLDQTEG